MPCKLAIPFVATVCMLLTACGAPGTEPLRGIRAGDAAAGAMRITQYGCGSCHTVPGVRGAHGLVGPSLAGFGKRSFIAGELPNEPANLVRWIRNPHAVNPRTAMPQIGVTDTDAKNISAYLYTLVEDSGGTIW